MLSHDFYGRQMYGDSVNYLSPWEMQRMKHEELRRRAAWEHAYRQRELEIQERERQKQMLRQRQREEQIRKHNMQKQWQQSENSSIPEVQYKIVLGPDGYLYRVPIKRERTSFEATTTRNPSTVPDENDREIPVRSSSTPPTKPIVNPTKTTVVDQNKEEEPSTPKADNTTKKIMNCHNNGVIVEDASDSESEDDDWKSIWRNRLPSPGQWMEPVSNGP